MLNRSARKQNDERIPSHDGPGKHGIRAWWMCLYISARTYAIRIPRCKLIGVRSAHIIYNNIYYQLRPAAVNYVETKADLRHGGSCTKFQNSEACYTGPVLSHVSFIYALTSINWDCLNRVRRRRYETRLFRFL